MIDEEGRANSTMKATVKDIARIAGVSIGTVDRVLHARGRVAPATARKVQEVAETLEYTPNLSARHLSKSTTFRFGVIMPNRDQDGGYWSLPQAGIERATHDLSFHKVSAQYHYFDRHSESSFEACIAEVMSQTYDGIVMAPVLWKASQRFVETNSKKGGPSIVLFDSRINGDGTMTFVGQDPFLSGVLAAKMLRILMSAPGVVLVVTVGKDDYHLARRGEGFRHFLENDRDFQMVSVDIPQQSEPEARTTIARSVPSDLRDVRGVFVTNALSHYVVRFFQYRGVGWHIPIIAYDLIPENVDFLRCGVLDFVISQKPERQGYEALYELYRQVALGKTPTHTISMPIELITKENVDSYLSVLSWG